MLLCSIIALSCNQTSNQEKNTVGTPNSKVDKDKAANMDWVLGNWKRSNDEPGKETFENWKKISLAEYSGIGFTIKNNDTISQESMTILEKEGKWKLLVKMPHEKEATLFDNLELSYNKFVFVNDSIDFPKKISYWLDGKTMKAKISNEQMEIDFNFEKIE